MGALPKQKISHSKQGRRRSHQNLKVPQLVNCTNCQGRILSHTVCNLCGHYKDEQVITIRQKATDTPAANQ